MPNYDNIELICCQKSSQKTREADEFTGGKREYGRAHWNTWIEPGKQRQVHGVGVWSTHAKHIWVSFLTNFGVTDGSRIVGAKSKLGLK